MLITRGQAQLFHSPSNCAINHGNKKSFFFPIRAKPMKQCGFHWNKAPITHFARSLFGNLVADSDQLFLPVDIFPPRDLVLGV